MILAVKLPGASEEHRPRGHVEPHGEGLGGEQGFDESLAEQNLNCLFQDGQKTRMMDPNSAF